MKAEVEILCEQHFQVKYMKYMEGWQVYDV